MLLLLYFLSILYTFKYICLSCNSGSYLLFLFPRVLQIQGSWYYRNWSTSKFSYKWLQIVQLYISRELFENCGMLPQWTVMNWLFFNFYYSIVDLQCCVFVVQQSESVMPVLIYSLFHIRFPHRLLQSIG